MKRHDMRKNAFLLVFAQSFDTDPQEDQISLSDGSDLVKVNPTVASYAKGVMAHRDELDELIGRHLKNWSLNRISKVSLAILRLAAYELAVLSETDPPIVINEAVELTKEYATKEDAAYVNGVLGAIAAERQDAVSGN